MSTDQATVYFTTTPGGFYVTCTIKHPDGLDTSSFPALLTIDRATLANEISQVKNSMPASSTAIWAALADPLAASDTPAIKARFQECMQNTIGEGYRLYSFLSGAGLGVILELLDKMPEKSKLTINTDCAFLPWEILYSRPYSANWPQSVKDTNPPMDPKRMWGYRFLIQYNLLDQNGTADFPALMAAHKNGQPFISLNLNASIANANRPFQPIAYHRDFYTQHLSLKKVGAVYDSATDIEGQLYSNQQEATVLYLYCHGRTSVPFAVNNNEALEFEPNGNLLDPATLGSSPNVYTRAPIVFLNSCTSGQPSPLSFSSFHAVFRRKQAMGIIGTSIEMPITFGAAFGCKLLEEYLKGQPLGVAIYALRRELVDKGNPLGLFYSLQCPIEVTAPGV